MATIRAALGLTSQIDKREEDYSDKELVDASIRGLEWASAAIYRRYRRSVFSIAYRIAGPGDAEEVCQEAFIRIFKGLPRFRGDSALGTWIYRLSVNAALSYATKAGKRRKRERPVEHAVVESIEMKRDVVLQRGLEQALSELSPGYRAILVLHDVQGLSHEQCAAILGCRKGTCKSQLHKARARMRETLQRAGLSKEVLRH